jgi:hypothetical protein
MFSSPRTISPVTGGTKSNHISSVTSLTWAVANLANRCATVLASRAPNKIEMHLLKRFQFSLDPRHKLAGYIFVHGSSLFTSLTIVCASPSKIICLKPIFLLRATAKDAARAPAITGSALFI